WGTSYANNYSTTVEALINDIQALAKHLSSINKTALRETKQSLRTSSLNQEQELLWWGQARYSTILGKPYRRIEDAAERLWWMAVEASALATDVDVEPAASFLMETLLQIDDDINTKRPLRDWLTELFKTLRRLHAGKQYADSDAMKLTNTLKQILEKDPLGLPVSWVHLQAIDSTLQEADFAERAKESLGLDLDIPIDRGEWAAWVFRESLLDWRLAGGK
ncbi:MAG TPA: GTPase-associated system all-helical protein GASH, partial [Hyalangium sp.]|nr:GTPase-associated system all-helical protein GASH [Hyalangium sp.]